MSNTVIKVENLTKEYKILHEKKDPYVKFSDALVEFSKKLVMPWRFFKTKEIEIFKALNDVNFEIKKGEKIAIIGRNGAGKSTLLKVLSRITEPTEGSVKIKGRVVSLLEVGTGFHPELTGRENIFLNGAVLGMTKKEIQEKFDDIVEFSGCEKFLDTPVKRYSSGMRVRLGFSVAAHLESEILIVDEVLAVGDAEFQKKCLGKMDEISKGEGRTIIFVSHNMSAVQNLCDKGIFIESGAVSKVGDIDSVIKSYMEIKMVSQTVLSCSDDIKWHGISNQDMLKSVKYDEDLKIKFSFSLSKAYSDLIFDVLIFNEKEERIALCLSGDLDKMFSFSPGTCFLEVNIKAMNLIPGSYYCAVYLGDLKKLNPLYHATDIRLFEVGEIKYEEQNCFNGRFSIGKVIPKFDINN